MLLDLLSTSNYISCNVQLANILGLSSAIYLSQLLDINSKAIKKDKVKENHFTLDREYIAKRTTISIEDQKQIDETLIKIGILERSAECDEVLLLNIPVLVGLITTSDEKIVENIKSLGKSKKSTKRTQRQAICDGLKQSINCECLELREAYRGWIDGVYANPNGFLSKRSIEIFQNTIDSFSNHNLDVALTLINIATVNGYRDATWAINKYKQNNTYMITTNSSVSHTCAEDVSEEEF